MNRLSWDAHFLDVAATWARMGTCPRLQVGAVLVRDRVQLSAGFNGAARGESHCTDIGCDEVSCRCPAGAQPEHVHCERAEHAERNAILNAAANGVSVAGSTCFTTAFPCWACARALRQAGVVRVVYREAYRVDSRVVAMAARQHIELVHLRNREDQHAE